MFTIGASKRKSVKNSSETESFNYRIGGNNSSEDSSWRESLNDAYKWEIIEYNEVIPIFEILPVDLRNQVLKVLGQKNT